MRPVVRTVFISATRRMISRDIPRGKLFVLQQSQGTRWYDARLYFTLKHVPVICQMGRCNGLLRIDPVVVHKFEIILNNRMYQNINKILPLNFPVEKLFQNITFKEKTAKI